MRQRTSERWSPTHSAINVTEKHLVKRAQAGDRVAFVALFTPHEDEVLRFLRGRLHNGHDAENVLQEALSKAFEKIHTLEGRSSFKAWLKQIALRCVFDLKREEASRRNRETRFASHRTQVDNRQPHDSMLKKELQQQVARCLLDAPLRMRLVVELRFFHEMTFGQIAQALDATRESVYHDWRQARVRLQEYLAQWQ